MKLSKLLHISKPMKEAYSRALQLRTSKPCQHSLCRKARTTIQASQMTKTTHQSLRIHEGLQADQGTSAFDTPLRRRLVPSHVGVVESLDIIVGVVLHPFEGGIMLR